MLDLEMPQGYKPETDVKEGKIRYRWVSDSGSSSPAYQSMIGMILAANSHAGRVNIETDWNFEDECLEIKVISGGKHLIKKVCIRALVNAPSDAGLLVYKELRCILRDMLRLNLHASARANISQYLADEGALLQNL